MDAEPKPLTLLTLPTEIRQQICRLSLGDGDLYVQHVARLSRPRKLFGKVRLPVRRTVRWRKSITLADGKNPLALKHTCTLLQQDFEKVANFTLHVSLPKLRFWENDDIYDLGEVWETQPLTKINLDLLPRIVRHATTTFSFPAKTCLRFWSHYNIDLRDFPKLSHIVFKLGGLQADENDHMPLIETPLPSSMREDYAEIFTKRVTDGIGCVWWRYSSQGTLWNGGLREMLNFRDITIVVDCMVEIIESDFSSLVWTLNPKTEYGKLVSPYCVSPYCGVF